MAAPAKMATAKCVLGSGILREKALKLPYDHRVAPSSSNAQTPNCATEQSDVKITVGMS